MTNFQHQAVDEASEKLQAAPVTVQKSRRRLARGAHSGQFSHDQAEVEREDAAEIAFIDVFLAPEGCPPQAAAVQDVGETALNVHAPFFEERFAGFAFHRAGGPVHGLTVRGIEVVRVAPRGIGVPNDGPRPGLLLDDGQLPRAVEAFVTGEVQHAEPVGAQSVKDHLMRGLKHRVRQAAAEDAEAGVVRGLLREGIAQKAADVQRIRAARGDAPRPLPMPSRKPTIIILKITAGSVGGRPPPAHVGLVMNFAEPVNLPGEIHAFKHVMEFGVKSVLRSFGQLTGLNPEIGLKGLRVFAAEFAHLPATLPGPDADSRKNFTGN